MTPSRPARFVPLIACAVVSTAAFVCWLPDPVGAGDPPTGVVERLIEQLGSGDFQTREMATRALAERDDATQALEQARRSADPEVARRAESVLDLIARRAARRDRERLARLAADGRIDLAVERLAAWEHAHEEDACWQAVMDLAKKLFEEERTVFKRWHSPPPDIGDLPPPMLPVGDFSKFREGRKLLVGHRVEVPGPPGFIIRAEEVSLRGDLGYGLAAVSGSLRTRGAYDLAFSVVLAGGSVEVDEAFQCIIVCDGQFRA